MYKSEQFLKIKKQTDFINNILFKVKCDKKIYDKSIDRTHGCSKESTHMSQEVG